MAVGAFLPYSGLADKLGFVALPGAFWLWMAGFLLSYAVLCHTMNAWFFKKFGAD